MGGWLQRRGFGDTLWGETVVPHTYSLDIRREEVDTSWKGVHIQDNEVSGENTSNRDISKSIDWIHGFFHTGCFIDIELSENTSRMRQVDDIQREKKTRREMGGLNGLTK